MLWDTLKSNCHRFNTVLLLLFFFLDKDLFIYHRKSLIYYFGREKVHDTRSLYSYITYRDEIQRSF